MPRDRHLVLVALLLTACPAKTSRKPGASEVEPCKRFGQTCEFSPGKLGSCVHRENCTGDSCLVCQSQH